MFGSRLFAVGTALMLAGSGPAWGASVSLNGTAATDDSTLYSNNPTHNAGGTARMRVGQTGSAGSRRAPIRFDLSSIPSGATVTSAALTLHLHEVPSGGPATTPQNLHRLTQTWVEGTVSTATGSLGFAEPGSVSWNSRGPGLWTTAGGDFVATASAVTVVNNVTLTTHTWSSAGMVADVQSWVSSPAGNAGWVLIGDEGTPQSARGFATSEEPIAGEKPVLFVEYTPASRVEDWRGQ